MKYFKFLIINIIAFATLFFLFSLLFPGQVITSKTVTINVNKQKVKEKIAAIENWKNWNSFLKNIEADKNNLTQTDTVYFIAQNNNEEKWQTQFIFFAEQENTTLLNWAITQKLPWYQPWKKFSAMVLNKEVAAIMDTSLNNFKTQIELER